MTLLMSVSAAFCLSLTLNVIINNILVSHDTYATGSSISLSIDKATTAVSVSSTRREGTFGKSAATTISASTSNATGYTIGISAANETNVGKLVNGADSDTSTNHLDSIPEATTEEQFKALSGTVYNGMWGYLPSKYNGVDNSDFLPAPGTSADIIDKTTEANTTANTYTLSIGARVDSSVKSGTYSNTFLVVATGNPIPYTITYIDPTVTTMPVDENTTSETSTVNISSDTPKRSGYTFAGWCTTEPTMSGFSSSCDGTEYGVGASFTLNQESLTNDLVLYAMWNRNTMQNVAEWGNSIDTGEETTAIDTRDGKSYSVARLCMSEVSNAPAANTCDRTMLWMTQNLDLALGPQGSQVLTNADSDLNTVGTWTPDTTTMQRPAVITKHAAGTQETAVVGWTNSNSKPYWAEGGDYYVYTSGNTNTDTIYNSMTACIDGGHTEEDCRHYHVGNYYNWSAAVASNDTSGISDDLTVMPDSICPKGWRLPNGLTGTNGNEIITEFNQLALANGITEGITTEHTAGSAQWINTEWATDGFNKFRSTSTNAKGYKAPLYFVRSGGLYGTTLYDYGTNGFLWSSTSQYTTIAYYLDFYSDEFYPASQLGRLRGFPVRCVAR
ncbi:hypothetical protein IKE99_00015 [Candidatus Saccharibacteria bacterium]|nr:hypothetical protein [Candidatus Saccharibacteria bacterium]